MDARPTSFTDLNLAPEILKAIQETGYTEPTPIQSEAVPELLAGHDVFASADTGTGKTAAFMLPALQKLSSPSTLPGKGPRILVLSPTRELATQITTAAKKYGKFLPRVRTVPILGGKPYEQQRRDLKNYVDILVATPGRLLDHTREQKIDYSRVEMFVLDEADKMLELGFAEDVEDIVSRLPKERQTVLFSATLKRVAKLAGKITNNPKTIEIAPSETTNDNVQQHVIFANDEPHKRKLLKALLAQESLTQAIVFSGTKAFTEVIADDLNESGVVSTAIHGDLRQRSREAIIRKLRGNKVQVLVATDVAARGIDVPGLSHVINYDLPRGAEDYTHRIGRTGRAGLSGTAITLVTRQERHRLRFIERDLGHSIQVMTIPGLEAKPFEERKRERSEQNGRGNRRQRNFGRRREHNDFSAQRPEKRFNSQSQRSEQRSERSFNDRNNNRSRYDDNRSPRSSESNSQERTGYRHTERRFDDRKRRPSHDSRPQGERIYDMRQEKKPYKKSDEKPTSGKRSFSGGRFQNDKKEGFKSSKRRGSSLSDFQRRKGQKRKHK